MMDRRRFLLTSLAGALAAPLAAEGQQAGKVYRIGYLTVPSRESAQGVANTFQLGLRDLGWIEGQNVVVDYRFAGSNLDRLPDLAAEILRHCCGSQCGGASSQERDADDPHRHVPGH